MKLFGRRIFILLLGIFLLLSSEKVFAESETIAKISDNDFHDNFEIQIEYLFGKAFSSRNVNNYQLAPKSP